MRHEISEPKHWRSQSTVDVSTESSWAGRRHAHSTVTLPADAVDAAFASESVKVEAIRGSRRDLQVSENVKPTHQVENTTTLGCPDLIGSLSAQLAMLEAQHEQLSQLLAQAQGT